MKLRFQTTAALLLSLWALNAQGANRTAHCEFLLQRPEHMTAGQELIHDTLNYGDMFKLALASADLKPDALAAFGLDVLPAKGLLNLRVEVYEIVSPEGRSTELQLASGFRPLPSLIVANGPLYAWRDSGLDAVTFEIGLRLDFNSSTYNLFPNGFTNLAVGKILSEEAFGRRYFSVKRLGPDAFVLELGIDVECSELAKFTAGRESAFIRTEFGHLCRLPVARAYAHP